MVYESYTMAIHHSCCQTVVLAVLTIQLIPLIFGAIIVQICIVPCCKIGQSQFSLDFMSCWEPYGIANPQHKYRWYNLFQSTVSQT